MNQNSALVLSRTDKPVMVRAIAPTRMMSTDSASTVSKEMTAIMPNVLGKKLGVNYEKYTKYTKKVEQHFRVCYIK